MKYIDLGLPSGTLWADANEEGFYTFDEDVEKFGTSLPTKEQFEELKDHCKWEWMGDGYKVTGHNDNSIVLHAEGYRDCDGDVDEVGSYGIYWSSTSDSSCDAWGLYFNSDFVYINNYNRCYGLSVRLVK